MNRPEGLICGKCPRFDLNTVSGSPVGERVIRFDDGIQSVIKLGQCRAPRGLVFSPRPENGICVNPYYRVEPASEGLSEPSSLSVDSAAAK